MIIDKLYEVIKNNGHVCVGIDTSLDYIPESFLTQFKFKADAIYNFNKEIIDQTKDIAACYKIQIAYYESLGIDGLIAYKNTLQYIRKLGAIVISDIKRGDISKTAEMYAKAHFQGDFETDFITLSPYMGIDSIEPYLDYVKNKEKGLFVLVRTSNNGAKDFQYLKTKEDKNIYDIIGEKIQRLGREYIGLCGYSSLGAVVGCTHIDEGIKIRKELNSTFFLIPGYGAQGGGAKDVAIYLKDGNGGVVNSSRKILLAYKYIENGENNFGKHARNEALRMRDEILREIRI